MSIAAVFKHPTPRQMARVVVSLLERGHQASESAEFEEGIL
jgi:hypothetical protein